MYSAPEQVSHISNSHPAAESKALGGLYVVQRNNES